ncbi:GNAT family N-acetyltransferase [Macrococcus lamae]|uniref:N-acetyltransferase n=1 Tax=Macrococcus lamae TaxID=198484 RepID=A0A4R6BTF5_9STAP|nr:GNAT family protein [Macrococcus lamae]TDM07932.1 N-acetyltransferase [Macrococcus lamae]
MTIFKLAVDDHITLVQPELFLAEDLFNVLDNNREHLREFLDFVDMTKEVSDERLYIKMMLEKQAAETGRLFLIYYDEQLVGTIDLHNIDRNNKKAEIGYWLDKNYNGRRITTKCVTKVCEIAFQYMRLNKLTIIAEVGNQGSNKVALNAGFTIVGTDKDDVYRNDQFCDMNRYALLKKDFKVKAN